MRYRVTHTTRYSYSYSVQMCRNQACLHPRQTPLQDCQSFTLSVLPQPADLRERTDFFGNQMTHFAIQEAHEKLIVSAVSELEIRERPERYEQADRYSWEEVRERLVKDRSLPAGDIFPFIYPSPLLPAHPELVAYGLKSFTPGRPFAQAVSDLMRRIYTEFSYSPGVTTASTPLAQVIKRKKGVCQDFAHFAIACLRSLGLAARYVSGYLETIPPPGEVKLVGADASHAWFAVYAPEIGWLDFDPTNNVKPGDQHVTVAWGRDFSDVSPLKGITIGGGNHMVMVSVDVARIS